VLVVLLPEQDVGFDLTPIATKGYRLVATVAGKKEHFWANICQNVTPDSLRNGIWWYTRDALGGGNQLVPLLNVSDLTHRAGALDQYSADCHGNACMPVYAVFVRDTFPDCPNYYINYKKEGVPYAVLNPVPVDLTYRKDDTYADDTYADGSYWIKKLQEKNEAKIKIEIEPSPFDPDKPPFPSKPDKPWPPIKTWQRATNISN